MMAAIPLLRDTPPRRRRAAATTPRPSLVVVPGRRRWPALLAVAAWSVVFVGLLGAAVFHTQLAERQLRIDRLERAVVAERERFDELRYQRAELRSPVRLATEATALGMQRGDATRFVDVAPDALARQLAAAGPVDDRIVRISTENDPLDQFRAVKQVTEAAP
jgi:hypothetical protein